MSEKAKPNPLLIKILEILLKPRHYTDDPLLKAIPDGVPIWRAYSQPEEPMFKGMYANRPGDPNKYRKAMGSYLAARISTPDRARNYALANEIQDAVLHPTQDHWLGASRADYQNVKLGIEALQNNMTLIQLLDFIQKSGVDRPGYAQGR